MRILFTFFASYFFIIAAAQKGTLRGRVFDTQKKIPVDGATIRFKEFDIVTLSDKNGNFRIDSLPVGKYSAEIILVGYPRTFFGVQIGKDSTSILIAEIQRFCKYDAHKKDQTCPVCLKKNKVIPIVYGLPVGEMDNDNYYYAGCEVTDCDPNWYCKRDKTKF